jgi:alpha-glucosidase
VAHRLCRWLGDRLIAATTTCHPVSESSAAMTFKTAAATLSIALLGLAAPAMAERVEVRSPGGDTVFALDDAAGLAWSLAYRGEAILDRSGLSLTLTNGGYGPSKVEQVTRRSADETWRPVAGRAAEARDHYEEARIVLREQTGLKRNLTVIVRAYDEGLAFRYVLPAQPAGLPVDVRSDGTEFRLTSDLDCWGAQIGRYESDHEAEYDPIRASAMRATHLFMGPLTCRSARGQGIAFAEADLGEWPGSYFKGANGNAIGVSLAPRVEDMTIAVRNPLGAESVSPWRVVMLAPEPGKLIESTLIPTLNPPSAIADTSWIKPGKTLWEWYAGLKEADGWPGQATYLGLIDFAADNGIDYVTIDAGWHVGGPRPNDPGRPLRPGENILKVRPGLDMPALVAHANQRGVGLMLWVHWKLLDERMDAALAQYAAWGIKGIKVDFTSRDDQQMVAWFNRLMSRAADHKLLVNMHSAFKPTGMTRTWPNYITQEGVMGSEYNKWSDQVTATHNVTIPYTRMLIGPMDYTPGGFTNVRPADFSPRRENPMAQYTRGQAVAMYVVYESPLQFLPESPVLYQSSPDGFDLIKDAPATWDETRFLSGRVGESIVLARRKGKQWWVGAMTNEQGRTVTVPLSFLGEGQWTADIAQDGAAPTKLTRQQRTVSARDRVTLKLAPSGGGAIRLIPR